MNLIPRFFHLILFKQEKKIATEFFDRQLYALKLTIFLTFIFKVLFLIPTIIGGNKSPHIPTNALTIVVSCIPAYYFLKTNKIDFSKFFTYFPTIFIQALSSYYVIIEGLPYGYAELALLTYIPSCILFYEKKMAVFGIIINILLFDAIKIVRFKLYHLSSEELTLDLTMSMLAYMTVILFAYLYKNDFFILKENNDKLNAQRKTIESQAENLKAINATKDKLFAILSHDLRSPVGSLKNYMMLINWGALSQAEFVESTQVLNNQLNNVQTMLDNVLNWSISQMGGMHPKIENVAVFSIIENEIQLLKSVADSKNISIENLIPPEVNILADKNHLAIIFRNLLQNALKFTNSAGLITFSFTKNESFSKIEVKDNGIGIAKEKLEKLFYLDKSNSNLGTLQEQGTGLGLVLVKELVEANGGKISVASEIGVGTTFTISWT